MSNLPGEHIPITEEEKSRITHLASLNYGPGQIAILLGYKKRTFVPQALDETTAIGLAYLRGRLLSQETVKQTLHDQMFDGNVTATQTHIKQSNELDFENAKTEIFDL